MLCKTCDVFDRRVSIYEPLVDSFVDKVTNEGFTDAGIHPLVPIKDSFTVIKDSREAILRMPNDSIE
jgi:magnesium transporter